MYLAPTRVKMRSITLSTHLDAGTKQPNCARSRRMTRISLQTAAHRILILATFALLWQIRTAKLKSGKNTHVCQDGQDAKLPKKRRLAAHVGSCNE